MHSLLLARWSARHISHTAALLLLVLLTTILTSRPASANPAFARKYGMPCSGCHVAWPLLNNFGQVFKDNGYQMMNDRDAPIWRDNSYWPIAMYGIPEWHRESANHQSVDSVPGCPTPPGCTTVSKTTAPTGFDFSGIAWWMSGTLNKNISFLLLPTFFTLNPNNSWSLTFESAWVRFDNLLGSSWLNLKMGKYELDLPVSEKRSLNFSNYGGLYEVYHFFPPGSNPVMIADLQGLNSNQLGVEVMGHNANSYTRYAVNIVSSNAGSFANPYGNSVDFYGRFEQAWNVPHDLGYMKASGFTYIGQWPTYFQTLGGAAIAGTGTGNKGWTASGASLLWFTPKWVWDNVYVHGTENAYLANNLPSNGPLPLGAKNASWNGGFTEGDYLYTPQLAFIGRYEGIRMAQQGIPLGTVVTEPNGTTTKIAGNTGNLDALTFGIRWYPFMTTRLGFAVNPEYSVIRSRGVSNNLFAGNYSGSFNNEDVTSSSTFLGLNFEF
jgi:hypothetical protein